MSYIANRDFIVEILAGNVAGYAMVAIGVEIETLTTTRITLSPNLTTELIDQSGLHSSAATVDVASDDANDTSAGTGLRTALLIGLDSSGVAQTETITMNGQTEVTSANTYSAINGFRALTAGSGNGNAGNIYIGNGTFTAGVPTTIYSTAEIGHNKTLTGYYTVPTGKTLFLRRFIMTMVGSNKEAKIHIETSSDGILWITEIEFGLESGPPIEGEIIGAPGIPGASHLRLTGLAGGASTELSIVLGSFLLDD